MRALAMRSPSSVMSCSASFGGRTFLKKMDRWYAAATRKKGSNVTSMDEIMNLCKRRGFVFEGSSIYGGMGSTYDYGPLGVQLKKNLQDRWWKDFVVKRMDCMGVETPIIMNPDVWRASGHVKQFTDPLIECKKCHKRTRADHLLEELLSVSKTRVTSVDYSSLSSIGRELAKFESSSFPKCSNGGRCDFGAPRMFNLLFRSQVGSTEDNAHEVYLRPETAQGVYVNYTQFASAMRAQLPFGVGQCGKSFRNEITLGNFIFRTREFDQMELQYFCESSTSSTWHEYWVDECESWLRDAVGLSSDRVRRDVVEKDDLAHYALASTDLEFKYPWGWDELWGIANRGSYDLEKHSEASGMSCAYTPPGGSKRSAVMPHVVEPALGLNRLLLATLVDAYDVEESTEDGGASRTVLRLEPSLAPFQFAILPLVKKSVEMVNIAKELCDGLASRTSVYYDEAGSIGKRYRRQDEIGTPVCVTVDSKTIEDGTVTLRARDSMEQRRVHMGDLKGEWEAHCAAAFGLGQGNGRAACR